MAKFFTWTKGDRRSAVEALRSGGVVPIPVECITIKGMDYARTEKRSSKAKSRPAPLALDGSPTPSSKHSSRTNNSIFLHDAAVKSATSLMTAMNDILNSPYLSAHLTGSQTYPPGLTTGHSRSRAYTAPSTPLVEFPPRDPVELPGSLPEDRKTYISPRQSHQSDQDMLPSYLGEKIERPRSSPQETTYTLPNRRGRMSVESFYRDATFLSPSRISPRSKSSSSPRNVDMTLPSYDAGDSQSEQVIHTTNKPLKRPPLTILPLELPMSSGLSTPLLTSQPGSMQAVPQLDLPKHEDTATRADDLASAEVDTEAALIEQISNLRASHEAHVRSLKEAHEKEIVSHLSYIRFLETRPKLHSNDDKHSLPLYTAQPDLAREVTQNLDNFATVQTSGSFDSQRSLSQDSVESIKRKLSLYRKAQADSMEVRKERDQLRDSADRSDRRILQLKDIVRKAKDNEKALKNAIGNLEARLVEANNERADVLEGFHEASGKLHTISQRELALNQELEDLRKATSQIPPASKEEAPPFDKQCIMRSRHKRTFSDIGVASGKEIHMSHRLRDLKELAFEKEFHVPHLEEARPNQDASASNHACSVHFKRIFELEREVEKYREQLAIAQADSERYNSLLHNELRRQSRNTADKIHAPIPQIDAEASALTEEKLVQLKAGENTASSDTKKSGNADDSQSSTLVASLQRELQYCIKEIILYKLDVRGYKKDLKKANAKIESLEATTGLRPPTPDRESPSSVRSSATASSHHRRNRSATLEQALVSTNSRQSGLGIALPEALETPEKDPNSTISSPRIPATPPPISSTVSSPPALRPRTPLGANKRLPKPPNFQTPTSLPPVIPFQNKTQLAATLRSFSDSKIASSANTSTVELRKNQIRPSNDFSTEPVRFRGSPAAPLSKFASRMYTDGLESGQPN